MASWSYKSIAGEIFLHFPVLSWKSDHQRESKDYLDEEYVDLDQVLADEPIKLDPKLHPDQRENPRTGSESWIEGSGRHGADADDVDRDDDDDDDGSGNEEFGETISLAINHYFLLLLPF